MTKQNVLLLAAFAALPAFASAQVIVDVDFESGLGNLVSAGSNAISASSGQGTGSPASFGTSPMNHGALVTNTTRAIDTEIFFSVEGQFNAPSKTNRQALLVGWTKDSSLATFDGSNTAAIGFRSAGNVVTFARASATSDARGSVLGTDTATLTPDNWYRFSGSILYNGDTGKFTYNNLILADIGSDGLGAANTVLSGSFSDVSPWAGDWTTASTSTSRIAVISGSEPGWANTDNYFVQVVPEPAAFLFLGLGFAFVMMRRRR